MGWRDVEYEPVPIEDSRLLAVTSALQMTHVNGGALLYVFRPINPKEFDTAVRVDLHGVDHLLRCFLEAPSVRTASPALQMPERLPELPKHTRYSGFEFEGAISHLLLSGGAYDQPTIGEDTARQLSRDFVEALAKERMQTIAWRIDEPWTDWFYDVAWDVSFVVYQQEAQRWALLCVTDTD